MKCINCEILIAPEFKACINSNICPACGKNIMKDEDRLLLMEIKLCISNLSVKTPETIATALLSNYKIEKLNNIKKTNTEDREALIPQEDDNVINSNDHPNEDIGDLIQVGDGELSSVSSMPSAKRQKQLVTQEGAVLNSDVKKFHKHVNMDRFKALADKVKSGNVDMKASEMPVDDDDVENNYQPSSDSVPNDYVPPADISGLFDYEVSKMEEVMARNNVKKPKVMRRDD